MFQDKPADNRPERTVTLSSKDISAARRLLSLLLGAERRSFDEILEAPTTRTGAHLDRPALVARAQAEFQNRRRRIKVFGQSMFGEPGWNMLLILYVLDASGQRQTVGSLLRFSGTSTTSASRWLEYLEAHDLVKREAHPTDRRTAFIKLTPKGREKLDLYYSETIQTGV